MVALLSCQDEARLQREAFVGQFRFDQLERRLDGVARTFAN